MTKMICFDMDGTIADLYGVEGWLSKLRAEDPSPYVEAKPIYDMEELNSVLNLLIDQGWEVRVISWLSKDASKEYNKAVRKAKRDWLYAHKFPVDKCHLIAYGTTKANCIRKYTGDAILVDDNDKVRDGWHRGETIDPRDGDLIDKLAALLN